MAGVMKAGPRKVSRSRSSLRRARQGRRAVSRNRKGADRHVVSTPP